MHAIGAGSALPLEASRNHEPGARPVASLLLPGEPRTHARGPVGQPGGPVALEPWPGLPGCHESTGPRPRQWINRSWFLAHVHLGGFYSG